jgi:hypothetical protein
VIQAELLILVAAKIIYNCLKEWIGVYVFLL